MARLLDFSQYIGGADSVIVYEAFKSSSKTYTYDFQVSIATYTFTANYRTILVDKVAYDRTTGDPNFTDSNVLGYFDNFATITDITKLPDGQRVSLTIPADRYTGTIMPDSRDRVPITVVTFSWDDGTSGVSNHRYAILERWSGEVQPGDPQLDVDFIPMGVGAITAITDNGIADATRATATNAPRTFTVSGVSDGDGDGALFQAVVDTDGDVTLNVTAKGADYEIGDTITILDSSLGSSGAPAVVITVASINAQGGVSTITDNASANGTRATVARTPQTFTATGLTSGEGQNATFQVIVEVDGDVKINLLNRGTAYNAGDTITILDSSIGASGADNITITISSVA